MSDSKIKARIDCPYCGAAQGMRVTEDKNGNPFGFCDYECEGQLRVGGRDKRVALFFRKYPAVAAAFGNSAVEDEPLKMVKPEAPAKAFNTFTMFD